MNWEAKRSDSNRRWLRVAGVSGLAVLCMAGSATAAPASMVATAQEGQQVSNRKDCSQWVNRWGADGYTFAKSRFCVYTASDSFSQVLMENNESTYFWGANWWDATPAYPATVTIRGTVRHPSGTKNTFLEKVRQNKPNKEIGLTPSDGGCGEYKIDFEYQQIGPYWTKDSEAINGSATAPVNVPCT
ncbi:hypothetical protein [Streptomyces sp. NPDC002746]